MSKKLNRIGYSASVEFDSSWKVVICMNGKEQYFYIFSSEEEAMEYYNNIN
jgi:hypothetical protein